MSGDEHEVWVDAEIDTGGIGTWTPVEPVVVSPPSGTASGDGPDWAKCQCVRDPRRQDYGPAQDCPQHGDVRVFAAWLAECNDELQRRSAALADAQRRIEAALALCDEAEVAGRLVGAGGLLHPDRIRRALGG